MLNFGAPYHLILKHFIMHLDCREVGKQVPADENMIKHLGAGVVQHAEPTVFRKRAVQRHHGAVCEVSISGVLFGPDHDLEWRFMILGVEISANRNCRVLVGVKQRVDGEPEFQRLRASL